LSLITTDLWQQRTQAATDFTTVAELSGGRGLPIVTCQRWGETIRIEPPVLSRVNAVEKSDGWEYELSAHQKLRYREVPRIELPDGTKYEPEHGALRVDFTCDSKPAANVLPLKLTWPKGARLRYQPALTQAEIDDGCGRPVWCIDSWACYAADGRKLGHIPRPWARDADGKWTWGTWQRDAQAGTLAKVIPQAWLDAAKYPVLIDDTFGWTGTGGTFQAHNTTELVAHYAESTPAGNGTLDSIYVYLHGYNRTCQWGVYTDDSDPDVLVDETGEVVASSGAGWKNWSLNSAAISSGVQYWFCGQVTGGTYYGYYDSGDANDYRRDSSHTYAAGGMPNPAPAMDYSLTRMFSAYAAYTPSGAGGAPTSVLSGSLVGPFGGPI